MSQSPASLEQHPAGHQRHHHHVPRQQLHRAEDIWRIAGTNFKANFNKTSGIITCCLFGNGTGLSDNFPWKGLAKLLQKSGSFTKEIQQGGKCRECRELRKYLDIEQKDSVL